jgi:fido (protein-threonine AMPylation protein)
MPDSHEQPPHRWSDIQRLEVLDSVTSIGDYERLIAIGALLAAEYAHAFVPDPFSPGTCRTIHRLMFEEVHPWAGSLRRHGESVIVAGFPCAEPWRIRQELELLEIQLNILREKLINQHLPSGYHQALLCAFHHIRFERIHPFRDGNGRVGRLLLSTAVRQTIDISITFDWAELRIPYFDALKLSNRGDLAPLANLILSRQGGVSELAEFQSPFRIAPRMFETIVETTLEDDLDWSRSGLA